MKTIALFFMTLSFVAFGQVSEAELNTIWNNCILPIAHLERDEIIAATEFPIEGEWAIVVGIENEPTIEQFKAHLEDIFPEDMRNQMLSEDFTYLMLEEEEDGSAVVSYSFLEVFVEEDTEFESMTFLTFEKINGHWKLVAITYAG